MGCQKTTKITNQNGWKTFAIGISNILGTMFDARGMGREGKDDKERKTKI